MLTIYHTAAAAFVLPAAMATEMTARAGAQMLNSYRDIWFPAPQSRTQDHADTSVGPLAVPPAGALPG